MTEKVFIDTNIFIYAYTKDDEQKNKISCDLLRENVAKENIAISTQIINEFYSVMTKYKYEHSQIKHYLEEIKIQVEVNSLSLETIDCCLLTKEKYCYSWWDSLVLASALESRCSILYSEDMQHGQVIENSLKIINPFIDLIKIKA
jgi:predicted nucleic acid-binding protein